MHHVPVDGNSEINLNGPMTLHTRVVQCSIQFPDYEATGRTCIMTRSVTADRRKPLAPVFHWVSEPVGRRNGMAPRLCEECIK
jgi:hypothetical protein